MNDECELVYRVYGEHFDIDDPHEALEIAESEEVTVLECGNPVQLEWVDLMPSIDNLIEGIQDKAFDVVGDICEGYFKYDSDALKELQKDIAKLLEARLGKIDIYQVVNVRDVTVNELRGLN